MLIQGVPWGAAFVFTVPLVTKGGSDYLANPTLAAGDAKCSKDNGAYANLGTLPSVDPASGHGVKVTVAAAEMEAGEIVVKLIDQTVPKEWEDQMVVIHTETKQGHASFTVVADGANSATAFEIDSTAGDDVHNFRLIKFNTGALAGQVRKVTDFDDASNFVTVNDAFTAAPSAGDKGVLINK